MTLDYTADFRKQVEEEPGYFQRLLDLEPHAVPDYLRAEAARDLGVGPIDMRRRLSPEFHRLEKEKVWPKVWQMVGREDDMPEIGDHLIYDICDRSVIVVRGRDNVIRGLVNSCLHRGRALRDEAGQVSEFRCPYHGFTWTLEGELSWMPTEWDFKHVCKDTLGLPQVRVETWAGFIFINFDPEAERLETFLGVLPEHYERFDLGSSYTAIHVQRRVPCNWKLAHEAFLESLHVLDTHPAIIPFTCDIHTQYDCFGENVSRMIVPTTVPSPYVTSISETTIMHEVMEISGRMSGDSAPDVELGEGQRARAFVGELNRAAYAGVTGRDLSDAAHSELQDAILYSVFPNIQVWGGYAGNIVYQFRPDGDRHDACIFDVRILMPAPPGLPKPRAVDTHVLGDDESFADAAELGPLGPVFNEDLGNLQAMMKGLAASTTGQVQLSAYQESRIRHLHRTMDHYIEK
jgi:nitrite reductase/ring-hydroxylating ferredoxin subunit